MESPPRLLPRYTTRLASSLLACPTVRRLLTLAGITDLTRSSPLGDEKSVALWRKFRDLSIVKYKETYARLNIYFDIYSGESQVGQESQDNALKVLQEQGVVEDSQGALIVNLEPYKLGKTIVRKKDGTSVYITRDIGGAAERFEKYHFDKMIYVVASQQDLHLAQFFKVLDLMKYEWASRLQHVNFGMVLGMSTRKGTAVFLDQILNESKDVMHEQMKKNEAKYNAIDDPEEVSCSRLTAQTRHDG